MRMESSPDAQRKRFSVEAFKFVGEFPFVYLHCSVVICRVGDPDSRCAKGCVPGLHVNPPWSVMEKLKEQESRTKRHIESKDPTYLISKGPFSLDEETANDGPLIALQGPQEDQSELSEDQPDKAQENKQGIGCFSMFKVSRKLWISCCGIPKSSRWTRSLFRSVFKVEEIPNIKIQIRISCLHWSLIV